MATRDRTATTAAIGIATVALTAAVISFTHVRHLALAVGETQIVSWLLPLSIDGAIAAAVAVILADSRAGRRSTTLTWLLLFIGILGSLAANIAATQPALIHAPLTGPLLAAWPPVALVLGVEVLASLARRTRAENQAPGTSTPGTSTPGTSTPGTSTPRSSGPAPVGPAPAAARPAPAPASGPAQAGPARPAQLGTAADTSTPAGTGTPAQPAQPVLARPGPAAPVTSSGSAAPLPPAAASGNGLHLVSPTSRPGGGGSRSKDADAIQLIRTLDEQAGGQASRRTIQAALGCGGSRADRLAAKARAVAASGVTAG